MLVPRMKQLVGRINPGVLNTGCVFEPVERDAESGCWPCGVER